MNERTFAIPGLNGSMELPTYFNPDLAAKARAFRDEMYTALGVTTLLDQPDQDHAATVAFCFGVIVDGDNIAVTGT